MRELALFRIVLMMIPYFWVEEATLHGALTLFEKLLTEIRGFSPEIEFCGIVVCLSVDRVTCGPEAVRIWSEFGSKIKLRWVSVLCCVEDFSVMVKVSVSEIISSSSEVERILAGDLSIDLLSCLS